MMLTGLARKALPLAWALCLLAAIAAYGAGRFASAAQHPPDPVALQVSAEEGDELPGRYIVILDEGVDASHRAELYSAAFPDAEIDRVYESALDGFAGELSENAVAALQHDPSVDSVQPDHLLSLAEETVPTGIRRVNAVPSEPPDVIGVDIDIDVAVIDTGVGPNTDLNVAGGFASFMEGTWPYLSCAGTGSWDDAHGHGTEVAGIVGARDDASGVVGVSPGARIWAVRVVGPAGFACSSDVIAGIDWVTQRADVIRVANMSLAGGNDPAICQAIGNSVAAGVTYVVAAGNGGRDVGNITPANCPDVIAVSAFADFDGLPGALTNRTVTFATCRESHDDSQACFSSYGPVVDLAAPGVEIVSTGLNGLSVPVSGTSFASPHVAGAAALYLSQHPGTSPSAVRAALIASGDCPAGEPVGADEQCDAPWPDDNDGRNEPLLRVRGASWYSEPVAGPTRTPTPTPMDTMTPTVTLTPTATLTPGPDRDQDQLSDLLEVTYYLTDPDDPDTDGDTCLDGAEVSSDPRSGGLRDPLNRWDFYDVNGDGRIDVANDLLPVASRYRLSSSDARYEARFDRGGAVGPYSWSRAGPDGRIDVPNDILPLVVQYNHRCR
jgi:subtilisin family serine protease